MNKGQQGGDEFQVAPSAAKVRVFLVDDHPVVRQGIAMLIDQEIDMCVCGEADNADDALAMINQLKPDLAIVDLSLKDSSGLELIRDLQIRDPRVVVLVLSMHDEAFYAERVMRAGARGYMTKDEGTEKVIEGIRLLLDGQVYVSDRVAAKMIGKLIGGRASNWTKVGCLTERELEVFELIGSGLGTREIAGKLHVSVKTIESHREHIKEKLGLATATELLKNAVQWMQFERKC
ncbi:MAG: response regulator transcription factor [Planctomycetes bacterium]|nr:response regulator transcription factor [Planctomycetota bacterium]